MSATRLCEIHLNALSDDEFEEWLCVFFQETRQLASVPQRVGRRGQAQKGVDVFARLPSEDWLGVQAKAYKRKRLTQRALLTEVKAAEAFQPALHEYVVCTLNARDAVIQEAARQATLHGQRHVSVLALEDLAEQAARSPRLVQDLISRADAGYVEAFRQVLTPPQVIAGMAMSDEAMSTAPPDSAQRRIEGWIDEGQPDRALQELESAGLEDVAYRRLLARARFALNDLDAVLDLAREELTRPAPDARLLAQGGHAAQMRGDTAFADTLLDRALHSSPSTDRPEVVAVFLRVHASRGDMDVPALERFATDQLGDPLLVALALADGAFMLGAMADASRWYQLARARRPVWPAGARINALGADLWRLILASHDGEDVDTALREKIQHLEAALVDIPASADTLRSPSYVNLGHAYRALRDYTRTADAWDLALAQPHVDASLWLHRCVLSATERVPLPSEALIEQWATTPVARLALATASMALGDEARATVLVNQVLQDGTTSDHERAIAAIERIRLRTGGNDDAVDEQDVNDMLGLYRDGNRTVPLLGWLVFHYASSPNHLLDAVREAIQELAAVLPLDTMQRVFLTEDLLRAGLIDVAVSWLPQIEEEAFDTDHEIAQVRPARTALRLYAHSFRFDAARRLIAQLRARRPDDAGIVLEGAHALEQAGDRPAAYALLEDAIRSGLHDARGILSWARLAIVVKKRRQARALMQRLSLVPQRAEDYVHVLQARAWLGVRGQDQQLLAGGAPMTPDTIGRVFGSGLIGHPHRQVRVAFGRIVHVRIQQGDRVLFDERIVPTDGTALTLPGVRAIDAPSFPWILELLDARVGDARVLTIPPFRDCTAHIVDVIEADRWSVLQAQSTVPLMPSDVTGIRAVSGDLPTLLASLAEHAQANQDLQRGVLQMASQREASIALTASVLKISPRLLLRGKGVWHPPGHSGTPQDIEADDATLATGARLVLDPISVLLLVELGAEALITNLPTKPAITPQAVQLLWDWWYAYERHRGAVVGQMGVSGEDDLVMALPTRESRRAVRGFWKRVQRLVTDHLDIVEPPPVDAGDVLRILPVLGPSMVTGMALAHANRWIYVTEEPMLRAIASAMVQSPVASVHRLIVFAAQRKWVPAGHAVVHLATMIRWGWRWVSFPVSMLRVSLRLPAPERWPTARALFGAVRGTEPGIAMSVLIGLLRDIDEGRFQGMSGRRLRDLVFEALPRRIGTAERRAWATAYAQAYPTRRHRASARCLRTWASEPP